MGVLQSNGGVVFVPVWEEMIRLLVKVTLRYSKTVCFHRRVAEIAEVSAPLGQFVAEGLRSYGESASHDSP